MVELNWSGRRLAEREIPVLVTTAAARTVGDLFQPIVLEQPMSRRRHNSQFLHPRADKCLPPVDQPVFFIAVAKPHAEPQLDRRFPYQRDDVLSGPFRLASARVWHDGDTYALYGAAANTAAAVEAAGRARIVNLSATTGSALAVQMLASETPRSSRLPELVPFAHAWSQRETRWQTLAEVATAVEFPLAA